MGKGFAEVTLDEADVLAAFASSLEGVRPRVRAGVDKIGRRLQADMRTRLTKARKIDTGRLYKAVAYRVKEDAESVSVEVGPRVGDPGIAPIDLVVDQGRRPGAPMPPKGALLGWMSRHGVPERAEYPIRRAIGRRGIPATPFIEVSLERSRAVPAEIEEVVQFVVRQFGG